MKKMWKRFVSLLLACTLLAGMLPLSASAAGEPTEMTEWLQKKVEEIQATVPEGSQEYTEHGPFRIGDSELYQYTLMRSFVDDEGSSASDTIILILPGVNAENTSLPDYKNAMDDQPWEESFPSQIYIAEGVTGIGNYTFANNNNLKKVVFQDASDLTYVGSYAFNGDSRAQFTDEGNSNAGGDDPTRILDLSHVEKMGENAFYNCDGIKGVELSGNIIAVETKEEGGTEEINHKIPNYAFGSCNALTSITVPEGITTIGTAAFAGCTQASSITLPDSLVTIGDRAFACSIDGDNKQLTALTIPENVVTIGASAFYGYTALTTVTVESTKLDKPGDAAFGNDDMSAYSGQQTVGDVTVENGGTTFKTPNAEITKLFVNHDNCYLGPISPLTLIEEESYPAMCDKEGRNVYQYTYNNEEEKRLEETLPPLQPHFTEQKVISATCRQPAYYEKTCDQWFEKDKETGKWVQTTHIHNVEIPEESKDYTAAKGHAYEVTAISNSGRITEDGGSQVTFVCKNDCHSEERDGSQRTVNLTLTLTQQEATTLQKLSDITLPVLTNGTLEWNEPNTELDFDESVQYFPVTFTPNQQSYGYLVKDGQLVKASECGKTQLTVGVKVEKVELDFSAIVFNNASVLLDTTSEEKVPISVTGAPTSGLTGNPTFRYYNNSGYADSVPPARNQVWSGMVSVTYQYNSDDYWVDPNTEFIYGTDSEPYTIDVQSGSDGNGTVTISHRYQIIEGNWDAVSAVVMQRTYGDDVKNTVHLIGVPKGATIEWRYASKGTDSYTKWVSQEMEETNGTVDIVPIQNAGDYNVEIKITYSDYDPDEWNKTLSVHVYKKAVSIPTAVTGLIYTGEEQTGVSVAAGMNDIYTLSDNTGIDAKGYTATATLTENAFQNYCWQGRGEDQQTAEISWSIAKRSVMVPNVFQTRQYQYNGAYQKIVSAPDGTNFEYVFPAEGKDVEGKFKESGIVAFTVTNGQAKDVGEYPIKATLENENYQWVGTGNPADGSLSVDLGKWEITRIYLTAPAFTASGKEYDGQPYDPDTLVQWQDGSRDQAVAKVQKEMKGSDQFTFSRFVYNSGGATAPEDAGSYTIQAEYTYPTQNYVLRNNTPRNFTIKQKSLTMQAPGNQELTYTGAPQEILGVTVEPSGLVEGDHESAYVITYSSQEWDETLNDGKGGWSSSTTTYNGLPSLEYVGRYLITAKLTSKNYTAEDVTYEVEISIATQIVKLTQEGGTEVADGGSISKTLGNEPFTVTGKGYVGETETNAAITYESSNPDTASVDGNGQVTLKKATAEGEPVTITVTAAGSANYQKATATYTITVGKGTPTVEVQMPEGDVDNTYSYTGEALTFSATVTGAGNGAVNPTTDKKVTYKFYNNGEGDQLEGEALAKQPTGIGTYWVEAVYEGDDNYNGATSDAEKFTISPAALKVEATGYDAIYDGRKHDPVKSIKVTGVDEKLFTKDDYTISYAKKTDGQTDAPAADSGAWKTDTQVKDVADSGDYWIKVVIKDDDSYNAYIDSVNVDIDPKPLTVTKTVTLRKTYDGTTKATVDFDTITTGITGELVTADLVSAVYNSPNVEQADTITITYKLTADPETDTDLANYSLDGKAVTGAEMDETVTEGVGITPASITVDIEDQKKVYDGSVATPSQSEWSVDEEKLYDVDGDGTKDNLGITLSIDSGSKNAGTYAITGTASNQNYEVTFTGSWKGEEHKDKAGTYTITPRPIDVKIGDAEGFYGDAPDLTLGTKVILTPETAQGEEAGLVNGENIYGALEGLSLGSNATVSSSVGENYTIYPLNDEEPVLDDNGTFGNYNVTFTNEGTYTVKPRPITITIEDKKSDYGCDIAQLTYNGTLSNTYTGSNKNVVFVGDDEDELGITLSTTAKKGSDAGTYPISGEAKAESLVVSNYAITWKGETPYQENEEQATYTVKKATLAVEFTNEEVTVSMGGTVNNPLKFINQSNSDEELGGQPQDVTVKYSSNDQGVATVNETTGEITLVGTGNATITAEVTSGGKNFTGGAKDSYIIHVAEDGGLLVTVTPKTLTYTGEMQNLISYSTAPAGAEVTFKVEAQTEGDRCQIASDDGLPQGQDAGTYRVSWVAKLQGYRDATGSTTVTIAKASPTTGFSKETVSVPYEENGTFDSTEETTLNVADDYKGTITYMSNDTRVASVQGNSLENISLNGTGSATITAVFTETDNYTAATASFRITVGTAETTISYTAEDYSVEYDRTAHGSKITVNSPSEYTIMYSDNNGTSYDLNESPTITDAGDLTIYFQIQADGYKSASGTQTVTVEPKPIKENMIAGIAESYTYTGKGITFDDAISVHDEGVLLKQNTDYTIDYGDNKEVGTGFVTITGMGNYTGEVIEHFDIIPVDGSSGMTASIDPAYGTYDPDGNTATVTVTHQTGSGSHDVDLTAANAKYTISATDLVTGQAITDHGATGTGNTLTFTKPAIYDITLKLTGDHQGEFHLSYTLLPLSNEDGGLTLTVDDETQKVFTYGGEIDPSDATIKVTANNTDVTDQCTLTYVYTPFEGTPTTTASPYTAEVLENAGVYTVTATPTDGSAITGTGTFTFLILQRDLSEANLTVEDSGLVYNQKAQMPSVTVAANGDPVQGTDYTITYYNNVNASDAAKAVVTATGNNFTGSKTAEFTIAPKPITDCVVENIPAQFYTGEPVIPPVTITDGNYTLILGYDYTTACADKGPGAATVTITGIGNYTETTTKDFVIKSEGAPEPSERFDLVVTPSQWTWGDDLTNLRLSVTFGTDKELQFGTDYTIKVDEKNFDGVSDSQEMEDVLSYIKGLKPGEYTITATGMDAYAGSTDTETVTIQKIQPTVTVTATPNSLSGGGKVTLTLKGEKLPNGTDLKTLLSVTAKNDNDVTLEDLHIQWPEDGSLTAELTLPNTNETYTFALSFAGNDCYESASSNAMVVVGQQTSGGGGGSDPGDQPADPDDTGVSDWLNTKDHLAYLAGYPGGTFGPDQNMTRAEAAQMFYNLLLEKDVEITVEFEDVPADAWYATPVNTLASLGILSGVGNGRFDPERSITRAEFTVIAMKFANTSGGGVNIFSDVNEDDWFYSAVVDSTQYGWINGYPDGTFRPEATISRAEVTVIVNHMLGRAADRPYVIAHEEELNTFGDVNRGHWGYFHVAEATNAHEYHTEDGTESWTGLS